MNPATSWANYQRQIYGELRPPLLSTDPTEWEAAARRKLPVRNFNYVHGAAGQHRTSRANIAAFDRHRLRPRMLRTPSSRDLSVTLFGRKYPSPLIVAPVGVQSLMHRDAELATARAAARLGVPFVLSTASSTNLEPVAEAHEQAIHRQTDQYTNDRWFQLYWPADDALTASLLHRAQDAGFSTLVVTLDTFVLGFRPADLDAAFLPFVWGEGCAIGLNDPVFNARYADACARAPPRGLAQSLVLLLRRSHGSVPLFLSLLWWHNQVFKSLAWLDEVFGGAHKTWQDLHRLRKLWPGPIVLKGIQTVEDARLAAEHGVDGIVVSNHGGRQADGAVASLDALAAIAADATVAQSGLAVLFDSGIRSGADVVKALALGAHAVLVGRPLMYGLALGGERGVEHVLRVLLAETDITMANVGCARVADLDRAMLQSVSL